MADATEPADRGAGRHAAVHLAAWFAAYFVSFGIFLPYFPIYLKAIGQSDQAIGLIAAVPLLARVVTLPVMGALADRFSSAAHAIRLYALIAATAALPLFAAGSTIAIALVLAVVSVFWTAGLPIADAAAIRAARESGIAYGRLRAFGSLAFLVTNLLVGLALARSPSTLVAALFVGSLWLTFAASLPLALPQRAAPPPRRGVVTALRDLARPSMAFLVAGAGLAQASHALLYGFGSIYWESRGWNAGLIGLFWAISVLAEVALFQVTRPLLRLFGAPGLIALGAAGGAVRWFAMLLEPGIAATACLQTLHGLSFGLTHLGLVHVIGDRTQPDRASATQSSAAMLTALAMGGATAAAGPLYAGLGVRGFVVMGALSALAFVLVVFRRRHDDGDRRAR